MKIITVDKLTDNIKIKTHLKYSKDFTFVPIKDNLNKELYIQTPKLFIPFGFKDSSQTHIDISFMNSVNDTNTEKLNTILNNIYNKVNKRYPNYIVNNFIKDDRMRLKMENYKLYNQDKLEINTITNCTYGKFIINLSGLWIVDNNVWFSWKVLQVKVDEPMYLQEYSFIDTKKITKIIPPPPPPPPPPPQNNNATIKDIINKNKKKINKEHDIINVPTLIDIQNALNNLQKINI